jgi:uncharacterized protein YaaQ
MSSNMMKMVLAIVRDVDEDQVREALIQANFRVTRIASTGGFFRRGNATFMIGVQSEDVDRVIETIRNNCTPTLDLAVKRATVFVLDIDHFEQV